MIPQPEERTDREKHHPHGEPQQAWPRNDGGPTLDRQRLGKRVKDFMAETNHRDDHDPKQHDRPDDEA